MQALIDFFTGMQTLDAVLVLAALWVSIAYIVICAISFLKYEIAVFKGQIDPEYYAEDDEEEFEEEEAEYYSDVEKEWH